MRPRKSLGDTLRNPTVEVPVSNPWIYWKYGLHRIGQSRSVFCRVHILINGPFRIDTGDPAIRLRWSVGWPTFFFYQITSWAVIFNPRNPLHTDGYLHEVITSLLYLGSIWPLVVMVIPCKFGDLEHANFRVSGWYIYWGYQFMIYFDKLTWHSD